jgi:erythromycin esterase
MEYDSTAEQTPLHKNTKDAYYWWKMAVAVLAVIVAALIAALIAVTFSPNCDNNESNTKPNKAQWLQGAAVNITQLNIQDGDAFDDLKPLSFLSGRDVVFLGEAAHGDGTPSHLRSRIIQYMHLNLSFNTVAWEISTFDSLQIMQQLQNLTVVTDDAVFDVIRTNMAVWPYWGLVNDTLPIFKYIAQSLKTNNPLELVG